MIKLNQPKFWKEKNIISYLLFPFSLIYYLGFNLHRFLAKPYKAQIFTISVGNINVGGGGKTPTSIAIAKLIEPLGKKICFISKGYGGEEKGPVLVNKNNYNLVGDEARLLSKTLLTIVANNKLKGLKHAEEQGFEIAIIDDALQTHAIHKDFSILVIDSKAESENKFLLPAGSYREPLFNALKRVDAVIKINFREQETKKNFNAKIKYTNIPTKPNYIAFCGLAKPEKFYNSLRELNVNVMEEFTYPDHHNYTESEIENLLNVAKSHNAVLITTEKDYVKLSQHHQEQITVLKIELEINNEEKLLKMIQEKI